MDQNSLQSLYQVVLDRKENPIEESYTCYLFSQGLDKILKKCGEECAETIIAAKKRRTGRYRKRNLRSFISFDCADGARAHPAGTHFLYFKGAQPKDWKS